MVFFQREQYEYSSATRSFCELFIDNEMLSQKAKAYGFNKILGKLTRNVNMALLPIIMITVYF